MYRNIKIYQSNFYFKNIILENNWKKVSKKHKNNLLLFRQHFRKIINYNFKYKKS